MKTSLLVDLYELTMAASYLDYKLDTKATFDLFVRQLPKQRGSSQAFRTAKQSRGSPLGLGQRSYFVAAGLLDALRYLEGLKFGDDELKYLKSLKLFPEKFLKYLSKFKFTGEVWALPEGTIFFPEEPILRVTAPIIEAQIVESALLNIINLQVTMATKASRIVHASSGKPIYDFSLRRTQGMDASLQAARCSYIAGCAGTSNVLAGKRYGIPVTGTMAHSFIMSFTSELASFRAFASTFPKKTILLIDTYKEKEGLKNAVTVAKEMEKKGVYLIGIRIDSGNLLASSKEIRKRLDREGLEYVKIIASGDLDEYKIKKLIDKGAKIDSFGVGTHMGTSSDLPYSDVIYKISAVTDSEGRFLPTMKLSQAKHTYPGIKQVWRKYGLRGRFVKDIICLEGEKQKNAKPLLMKVMKKGKRIYKSPSMDKIRKYCLDGLLSLPFRYKRITEPLARYPVTPSIGLTRLTKKISREILNRSRKLNLLPVIFMDIDTQYDFIDKKGKLAVPEAYKIIPNLKCLTEFAKRKGILVIASQDKHLLKDPEFRIFPPHCVTGTYGQKKISATKIKPSITLSFKKKYPEEVLKKKLRGVSSVILNKKEFSVFTNPNTARLLRNALCVYLYGVATEYCVREAALGLTKLGIKTILVTDAIRAVDRKAGRRTLEELKNRGVEFITTAKLIKELR